MVDPLTLLSNPALALAADKAFDLSKDFITGRLQSRRDVDDAWERIEASITAAYAWIGRGELRKLRAHPEIDRELRLAIQNGWKPSTGVLQRALEQVCQEEGIAVEGRPLAEVADRLVFLWSGYFTVGSLGALADLRQEIQTRDRQDTRNISLAYQETVAAQRSMGQELLHQQLELAKRYIDEGQFENAWDLLELASRIPEEFGWTNELRYAFLTRRGCCHLALGRSVEAKAAFAESLVLRPDYPQAITNLVIARDVCDDPVEESLAILQPVIDAHPLLPEAVHTKANLLLTLGKPEKAIELLENQANLLGDSDIRRDYALANAYRLAGDHESAETLARHCVMREPNEPEAHEILGDVLLTQAITTPSSHGLVSTVLSELAIDRSRLVEATGEFAHASTGYITQRRSVAAARCDVNRGLCLLELGNVNGAIAAYERATATLPPKGVLLPALRGLARAALSSGDMETARTYFNRAAELDPTDASTIYNLCLTLTGVREFGAAQDQLLLLQAQPDLPEALRIDMEVLRAQILWRQAGDGELGDAQRQEAEAILEQAALQFPNAWQILLEQTQWRLATEQTVEALSLMKQALTLAPENLLVLEIAARLTLDQDAWEDFAEISKRLIECNRAAGRPNNPALYHNCAAALVNTGQLQEALEILNSAGSEGLHPTELLDMRAAVFARLHRHREARDCWRQLLDAQPDSVRALVGLGQAEWNLFNLDEAYRLLVRAYELGDRDPSACFNIATICRELGAPPEAVRWAEQAVAAGADVRPELLMSAINAAREAGRRDLVSAWMQSFRSNWPESPLLWVREAASREEMEQQKAELKALQTEQVRLAWLAYQSEPIPLARLAQETGTSLPSVWEKIVQADDGELEIRCHTGSEADDELQSATAIAAEWITVDLTALLTLDYLGHLYLLPRMYRSVSITDEFLLEVRNAALRSPETGVHPRLRRIIEFMSRNSVVVRVGLPVRDIFPDMEQVTAGIGEIGTLPLLTAIAYQMPLLTDEVALQWAARDRGVTSFGICGLLKAALRKNLIDEGEYKRSIRQLIAGSYSSIPFTRELLAETIRLDPQPENRVAKRMLAQATRATADRLASAEVLAGTLKLIWADWPSGYDDLRAPWVELILDSIHHDDPDLFWLRWAVYRCSVNLCRDESDEVAAGCVRSIIDWGEKQQIPIDELANPVGQGARDLCKKTELAETLIAKLTSACPASFRELVQQHAVSGRFRLTETSQDALPVPDLPAQ